MNRDLEQLERSVQAELDRLGPRLDVPPPRAEWVRAVKIAVGDEVSRWNANRRRLALLRTAGGLAAAVLLAIGVVHVPQTSDAWLLVREETPEQAVADWLGALEDSSDQLGELVEQVWMAEASPADEEPPGDPFRYIEESLEYFGNLSG